MADEPMNPANNQTIDYHIVTLFEKLESLKSEKTTNQKCSVKLPIKVEIRTLEFWRSVICECLGSFMYVFIVCGAIASAGGGPKSQFTGFLLPTAALAAGFAMISLTECFANISGALINPAVTVAMGLTKNISLLRTVLFLVAQCGGAIAGSAFLYGVTASDFQFNSSSLLLHFPSESPWEKFGIEFILTFIVVFSYFVSMDARRKWMGTAALTIGTTYTACSFVSMPHLNPARSLGPAFVLNKWENHWVYWVGPIIGGATAGIIYEYIFNSTRRKPQSDSSDGESSSIHSEEDPYDDVDKPVAPKFHGSTYNTYRPPGTSTGPPGYASSLYSAPVSKLERVESIYGGTKSLYCQSPPLTRANLNRSQSVYTKSNSAVNREMIPKPGPLVPAQSLYPIRPNQSLVQNQNLQNQQRSGSVYGTARKYPTSAQTGEQNRRPESVHSMHSSQRRGQSAQSAQSYDSSYESYHGPSPTDTRGKSGNYGHAFKNII